MRLENKSERTFQHSYFDKDNKLVILDLKPRENKEIPDEIAAIWLATKEVIEYIDPAVAKAQKKVLEDENAKLKAEIEKLKKAAEPKGEPAKAEPKPAAKKVKK